MTTEQETIIDITEVDPTVAEELVEKSGIQIWLTPRPWVIRALENKKTTAAIILVTLLILTLTIVSINLDNTTKTQTKEITTLKKDNKQLQSDLDYKQTQLNKANSQIQDCQTAVETAWKAWNRRNDLVVSLLSNLFTDNSTDIDSDNTLAAAEFLTAYDCNPNMLSSSIFTQ